MKIIINAKCIFQRVFHLATSSRNACLSPISVRKESKIESVVWSVWSLLGTRQAPENLASFLITRLEISVTKWSRNTRSSDTLQYSEGSLIGWFILSTWCPTRLGVLGGISNSSPTSVAFSKRAVHTFWSALSSFNLWTTILASCTYVLTGLGQLLQ